MKPVPVSVGALDVLDRRLTHMLDQSPRTVAAQRRPPRDEEVKGEWQGKDRDDLTGMASRSLFLSRLRRSTAPGWCVDGLFVLLVDIDAFREVNERYGYDAADELIVEAAARLKKRLRPSDLLARFGGDEFAVLVRGMRSGSDVTRMAERLQAELSVPFARDSGEVRLSASVGVAMGLPGTAPEHIIRDAERALARAKLLGGAGCELFVGEADAREGPLQRMETALRRVLEQEEFRARYRPTVRRKDGSVPGFEIVLFRRVPPGSGAGTRRRAEAARIEPAPGRTRDVPRASEQPDKLLVTES